MPDPALDHAAPEARRQRRGPARDRDDGDDECRSRAAGRPGARSGPAACPRSAVARAAIRASARVPRPGHSGPGRRPRPRGPPRPRACPGAGARGVPRRRALRRPARAGRRSCRQADPARAVVGRPARPRPAADRDSRRRRPIRCRCASSRRCPRFPSRDASSGSRRSSTTAIASAWSSPGAQTAPQPRTTSGTPPTPVATTGRPCPIASRIDIGSPSEMLVMSTTSAAAHRGVGIAGRAHEAKALAQPEALVQRQARAAVGLLASGTGP